MFERLSRSWGLVKASGAVLKEDKELLVFPLISSLAMLGVIAAFASCARSRNVSASSAGSSSD